MDGKGCGKHRYRCIIHVRLHPDAVCAGGGGGSVLEQAVPVKDAACGVNLQRPRGLPVAQAVDDLVVFIHNGHAERAGVKDKIKFSVADVKDFKSELKNGTIVTNPPYGERLLDVKEARNVIAVFGRNYKKTFDWSAFVISSDAQFERYFGRKADKKRKLYNAKKECNLYQYFKQSNPKQYFCKMSNIFAFDEK